MLCADLARSMCPDGIHEGRRHEPKVPVLQDARKGVLFDDFPPVLQLQLKRFEYDFQRDIMIKV